MEGILMQLLSVCYPAVYFDTLGCAKFQQALKKFRLWTNGRFIEEYYKSQNKFKHTHRFGLLGINISEFSFHNNKCLVK